MMTTIGFSGELRQYVMLEITFPCSGEHTFSGLRGEELKTANTNPKGGEREERVREEREKERVVSGERERERRGQGKEG